MKNYFKRFFDTYKSAKWIVLKYLVISIYLIVSSVIANNLNLNNLTYYNAIIGLCAIADLISFGISNGIGIFINQNIDNSKKVDYYAKIGVYISTFITFVFCLLLIIPYKFILHDFLGLPQGINYTFYFLMVGYMFMYESCHTLFIC